MKHIKAEDKNIRDLTCGSKYVQSNLGNIFSDVELELRNGRKVLFSGTGCQVDGLLKFLKMQKCPIESLITIDIVCHGVLSPLLFDDYKEFQNRRYGAELNKFNFRDKKRFGWESSIETFEVNGKVKKQTIFTKLFQTDMALRSSCYYCPYASTDRVSDITLADAWGVGEKNPEFHDNRGVSLVLVNTEKGNVLFEKVKNGCTVINVDINEYLQPNLKNPSQSKGDRNSFWKTYYESGFDTIVGQYAKRSLIKSIKNKIKRIFRKISKGKDFYLPL